MKKHRLMVALAAAACSALVFAAVALATTIKGTHGDDTDDTALDGTAEADKIIAKKGDDDGDAGDGDDYVNAGGGGDEFDGGDGNDRLSGKAGDDELNGDEDNDFLTGGTGDDELDGGPGIDTIKSRGDGKAGDDIDCGGDTGDTVKAGPNDTWANCDIVEQTGSS